VGIEDRICGRGKSQTDVLLEKLIGPEKIVGCELILLVSYSPVSICLSDKSRLGPLPSIGW